MKLDPINLLISQLVNVDCMYVKIHKGELFYEERKRPFKLKRRGVPLYNLVLEVSRHGEKGVYITEDQGKVYLLEERKPVIVFQDITFIGYSAYKTPILRINGVECQGYNNISQELFGYKRFDIKEIVSSYIIEPDYKTPQLESFTLIKTIKGPHGSTYPMIGYGKLRLKGVKALKDKYPEIDTEAVLKHIGYVRPESKKRLKRHEVLIKKYKIHQYPDHTFELTYENQDHTFTTQKGVIDFIKDQGDSISRETVKNLFSKGV